MRRVVCFYWGCLKEAVTGSLSLANAWAWLAGPVLFWLALKWWGYTLHHPSELDLSSILLPLGLLAAARFLSSLCVS
jgi:hypothetical protein